MTRRVSARQEEIEEEEHADDKDNASDSEYDEDTAPAGKRTKTARSGSTNNGTSGGKAGAALRTTIACTELRSAFLADPHPPTTVLDQLATRLGLGKKQVSNYFVRERKKAGYLIKVRHGINNRRRSGKQQNKVKSVDGSNQSQSTAAAPGNNQVPLDAIETEQVEEDDDDDVEDESAAMREASVSTDATEEEELDEEAAEMDVDDQQHPYAVDMQPPAHMSVPSIYTTDGHVSSFHTTAVEDDVPDLAYDDVSSLRSENLNYASHSGVHLTVPHAYGNRSANAAESISSLLMLASKSNDGSVVSSTSDDLAIMSPPNPVLGLPSTGPGSYHAGAVQNKTEVQVHPHHHLADLPLIG